MSEAPILTPETIANVVETIKAVDKPPKCPFPEKPEEDTPTKVTTETRHWWQFWKPTEIKVVYYKEPLNINDPLTHTQFTKWAKEAGFVKPSKELTTDQKVIRGALVSFAVIVLIMFFKWVNPFVIGNTFIGTWADVLSFLETIAIVFMNVVFAKIKQAYAEKNNKV